LLEAGFPLSFDTEIQGLFKDVQGPSNFIFNDQFSTDVYSACLSAVFASSSSGHLVHQPKDITLVAQSITCK